MTSVNITTTKNNITVNEGDATVVTVATQGPQGETGIDLVDTNKVNKSIIYYDSAAGTYKAHRRWTATTLTDGGNF